MGKRFVLCTLFYLPLFSVAFAQEQMPYTDTVIIEKDPLVIKKEVLVHTPTAAVEQAPNHWKIGLSVLSGTTNATSHHPTITTTASNYQSLGIELKHQLGHLEIGTGIGVWTTSVVQKVQYEREYNDMETRIVRDTLDCWTTIINGKIVTECHYEDRPVSDQVVRTEYIRNEQTFTLQYLQIPLSLGYVLHWRKWYLTPTLQVLQNRVLGERAHYSAWNWTGGGQLLLGNLLSYRLSAEVKVQYHTALGSPATHNEHWQQLAGGIACYFHF